MKALYAIRAANRAQAATIDAILLMDDGEHDKAAHYLDEAEAHLAKARERLAELRAVAS